MLSKIQYNNCETGEYKEEKDRTLEESIRLIETFPWEEQRKNLRVDLTNPSITLENAGGDFLKLALYYNGKFVLYFLDRHHKLYIKSFFRYSEAYPFIKTFFESQEFDPAGFRRQPTMFSYHAPFIDQDFHYHATTKDIINFLLRTTSFNFIIGLTLIGTLIYHGLKGGGLPGPLIVFIGILTFAFGGGLHMILFSNYYRYAKDKLLIMSRGNDTFFFGPENAPQQFDKKQIAQITRYDSSGRRNAFGGYEWVSIEFQDGNTLVIPSLLIDSSDLVKKFPGIDQKEVRTSWPTIPRGASTLFG